MDMPQAICEAGRRGILDAREIGKFTNDNEMSEPFLSGMMARHLHTMLQAPVRTELPYIAILKKLDPGFEITPAIIKKMGGLRADVVIYEKDDGKLIPYAAIENKIFDESCNKKQLAWDLEKAQIVRGVLETRLEIYLGVMICQTTNEELDIRQAELEEALKKKCDCLSDAQMNSNRKWSWRFACLKA